MVDPRLLESIKKHEGLRLKAYQDSRGVWTIGYGRNLQQLRISKETAEQWLIEDIENAILIAASFPEYWSLNTRARRNVFIEMVFNLGPEPFDGDGYKDFKNFLAAVRAHDWERAADEMLNSLWHKQVGKRAETLAELMRRGTYTDDTS